MHEEGGKMITYKCDACGHKQSTEMDMLSMDRMCTGSHGHTIINVSSLIGELHLCTNCGMSLSRAIKGVVDRFLVDSGLRFEGGDDHQTPVGVHTRFA
jgi:predicted RNA-binding Zn-ribbon protein involved in translation (DUF1610 family)